MKVNFYKGIKHPEHIKIINLDLFSKIILLDNQYKTNLNNIISLNYDLKALEDLFKSTTVQLHETNELKDDLKQKEWFFLV
ncbi:MAG: hypothetical protein ACFE94_03090 [Candidatus Hodarchaeota archaeon]